MLHTIRHSLRECTGPTEGEALSQGLVFSQVACVSGAHWAPPDDTTWDTGSYVNRLLSMTPGWNPSDGNPAQLGGVGRVPVGVGNVWFPASEVEDVSALPITRGNLRRVPGFVARDGNPIQVGNLHFSATTLEDAAALPYTQGGLRRVPGFVPHDGSPIMVGGGAGDALGQRVRGAAKAVSHWAGSRGLLVRSKSYAPSTVHFRLKNDQDYRTVDQKVAQAAQQYNVGYTWYRDGDETVVGFMQAGTMLDWRGSSRKPMGKGNDLWEHILTHDGYTDTSGVGAYTSGNRSGSSAANATVQLFNPGLYPPGTTVYGTGRTELNIEGPNLHNAASARQVRALVQRTAFQNDVDFALNQTPKGWSIAFTNKSGVGGWFSDLFEGGGFRAKHATPEEANSQARLQQITRDSQAKTDAQDELEAAIVRSGKAAGDLAQWAHENEIPVLRNMTSVAQGTYGSLLQLESTFDTNETRDKAQQIARRHRVFFGLAPTQNDEQVIVYFAPKPSTALVSGAGPDDLAVVALADEDVDETIVTPDPEETTGDDDRVIATDALVTALEAWHNAMHAAASAGVGGVGVSGIFDKIAKALGPKPEKVKAKLDDAKKDLEAAKKAQDENEVARLERRITKLQRKLEKAEAREESSDGIGGGFLYVGNVNDDNAYDMLAELDEDNALDAPDKYGRDPDEGPTGQYEIGGPRGNQSRSSMRGRAQAGPGGRSYGRGPSSSSSASAYKSSASVAKPPSASSAYQNSPLSASPSYSPVTPKAGSSASYQPSYGGGGSAPPQQGGRNFPRQRPPMPPPPQPSYPPQYPPPYPPQYPGTRVVYIGVPDQGPDYGDPYSEYDDPGIAGFAQDIPDDVDGDPIGPLTTDMVTYPV
jgi:hypothetical protein